MTVFELNELTTKAIALGFGDNQVLVFSKEKAGYDICRQARFERIWLDLENGILPSEPGVNALLLTAKAAD